MVGQTLSRDRPLGQQDVVLVASEIKSLGTRWSGGTEGRVDNEGASCHAADAADGWVANLCKKSAKWHHLEMH